MYGTVISVIDREIVRCFQAAKAPIVNMMRNSAFNHQLQRGVDMSGSWDQTILRRNDVDAY